MTSAAICQSCAMPLEKAEDFGTNAGGSENEEFCTHCYQDGDFTQPDVTMDEMIDIVASFMDMPEGQATTSARSSLVGLNRWRNN